MIDTKQKILDTAERLFGEHGYASVSLRQVIAEAEVNIAAVHYHFGSKEDLLDAVLLRKIGPVTAQRMENLDRVLAEAGDQPPCVEKLLEAFLLPTAAVAQSNPIFVKLMGRMIVEGLMPQIAEKHFRESGLRLVAALSRSLPHLTQDELMWRVHFAFGAMAHTMTGQPIMSVFAANGSDFSLRLRRLVKFLSAGFRAPAEGKEKK